MDKEYINGLMEENMSVLTNLTRKVDLESITGRMEEYFRANGYRAREMDQVK